MNWDRIEGRWGQLKGKAREQWGKLTDSDIEQIAGKKDQLLSMLRERYGIAEDEAKKQVEAWSGGLHDSQEAIRSVGRRIEKGVRQAVEKIKSAVHRDQPR